MSSSVAASVAALSGAIDRSEQDDARTARLQKLSDAREAAEQARAATEQAARDADEEEKWRFQAAQIICCTFMRTFLTCFNQNNVLAFSAVLTAVLAAAAGFDNQHAAGIAVLVNFINALPPNVLQHIKEELRQIFVANNNQFFDHDGCPSSALMRNMFPAFVGWVTQTDRNTVQQLLTHCCALPPLPLPPLPDGPPAGRAGGGGVLNGKVKRRRFKIPKNQRLSPKQTPPCNACVAKCVRDWNAARGSSSTKGTKRNGSILPKSLNPVKRRRLFRDLQFPFDSFSAMS